MPDFDEPEGLKERFDRLERMLSAQGRALAFLLASVTQQPAQLTRVQDLLDELGREMPGAVLPASGLVLGS